MRIYSKKYLTIKKEIYFKDSILYDNDVHIFGSNIIENNKNFIASPFSFNIKIYKDLYNKSIYIINNKKTRLFITKLISQLNNYNTNIEFVITEKNTCFLYKKIKDFRHSIEFEISINKLDLYHSINLKLEEINKILIENNITYFINLIEKNINILNRKILNLSNNLDIIIPENFELFFRNGTSGYLFHEIIGHLFEYDLFSLLPYDIKLILNLNKNLNKNINILDSVKKHKKEIGIGNYDDDGNPIKDFYLIEDGIIKNHIQTSKYKNNKNLYGNSKRSHCYTYTLPRMRSTLFKNNTNKIYNLNSKTSTNKLIIENINFAFVNPNDGNFQIILENAIFQLTSLKQATNINKIFIKGNVKNIFNNICYIGNNFDYKISKCIKDEQIIKVITGGVDLGINNYNIEVNFVN